VDGNWRDAGLAVAFAAMDDARRRTTPEDGRVGDGDGGARECWSARTRWWRAPVDLCARGAERAMVARGVVVIGARADPVILVPTRVASLPAGAASTARAIVDMGALVAPGDGRALRCVGLLAGRCAAAVCNRAHFFLG
jgi:hypothetical protein